MPLIKTDSLYKWWWCGLIQTGDAGQNGERGQPGLPGLKGDHGLRGPQGPRGKWCNCSLQFALDVLVLDCHIHSNILTTLIHWTRSLRDPDYNSGHSTKSYSYLLYASVYSIRSFRQIRFTILVTVSSDAFVQAFISSFHHVTQYFTAWPTSSLCTYRQSRAFGGPLMGGGKNCSIRLLINQLIDCYKTILQEKPEL